MKKQFEDMAQVIWLFGPKRGSYVILHKAELTETMLTALLQCEAAELNQKYICPDGIRISELKKRRLVEVVQTGKVDSHRITPLGKEVLQKAHKVYKQIMEVH